MSKTKQSKFKEEWALFYMTFFSKESGLNIFGKIVLFPFILFIGIFGFAFMFIFEKKDK